jgi:hypothetical protein
MQKKVAQIWVTDLDGHSYPHSEKYYSKVGVAENVAEALNEERASAYFVRVYSLEFIGDIR